MVIPREMSHCLSEVVDYDNSGNDATRSISVVYGNFATDATLFVSVLYGTSGKMPHCS